MSAVRCQALVGAILSGSVKGIQETAGLLPKSELQESFPETQPTPALESQKRKRQLPWDAWHCLAVIRKYMMCSTSLGGTPGVDINAYCMFYDLQFICV